jgi:fumarate hydratase class II
MRHDDQFPIDVYQTGSGTSTNTNMNEVRRAPGERPLGGRKVHPNDDVNRCQSSNDTIPTALQLSAAIAIEDELLPALERLHTALVAKEHELLAGGEDRPDPPPGRDADPARQEFRGYAGQLEEAVRRARAAQAELLAVPLGWHGRSGPHQRPPRVRLPDVRPPLVVDGPDRPRGTEPLPCAADDRRGDRRARVRSGPSR